MNVRELIDALSTVSPSLEVVLESCESDEFEPLRSHTVVDVVSLAPQLYLLKSMSKSLAYRDHRVGKKKSVVLLRCS